MDFTAFELSVSLLLNVLHVSHNIIIRINNILPCAAISEHHLYIESVSISKHSGELRKRNSVSV